MSKNQLEKPNKEFDFTVIGAAIKKARTARKESRNVAGEALFITPRYLANIENSGDTPSLQLFYELVTRYNISVDKYFYPDSKPEKDTARRQLDTMLDAISDENLRFIIALTEEIYKAENEDKSKDT